MCLNIYLGAEHELPLVAWNENEPGFYLYKLTEELELKTVNEILASNFIYTAGSWMGCACGLSYEDWSKESKEEQHDSSGKDVKDFINYLEINMANNELKLFCTWWEEFPDKYETIEFDIKSIDDKEFEFAEDKILLLKK